MGRKAVRIKKSISEKSYAHNECRECPATCCKDLAMSIGKPKTKAEIEDLKWQVRFDTVDLFIRSHHWYLRVKGSCMYLDKNNMCTIYKRRPAKCRAHRPPFCERYGEYHEVLIRTPEELEEYLSRKKYRK